MVGDTTAGDAKELLAAGGDELVDDEVTVPLVSLQMASILLGQHGSVDC